MTLEFKTYFTIIERSQLYHSLYFLLYSSSMLNKSITCYTSWTCWASILIHSFPSWPADIQGWPWEDWWRTWALLCALAPSPSAETSAQVVASKTIKHPPCCPRCYYSQSSRWAARWSVLTLRKETFVKR